MLDKNLSANSGIVASDKRGKHPPANTLQCSHILKFPKCESHYSREKSKREYLGSEINRIAKFKMYSDECYDTPSPPPLSDAESDSSESSVSDSSIHLARRAKIPKWTRVMPPEPERNIEYEFKVRNNEMVLLKTLTQLHTFIHFFLNY